RSIYELPNSAARSCSSADFSGLFDRPIPCAAAVPESACQNVKGRTGSQRLYPAREKPGVVNLVRASRAHWSYLAAPGRPEHSQKARSTYPSFGAFLSANGQPQLRSRKERKHARDLLD